MNIKQYSKHFSILFSGSLFAQILNFLFYPLLTHIYSPKSYGFFVLLISISLVVGAVSCGRFDAVLQVCQVGEKRALFYLSQLINIAVSTLFFLVLYVLSSLHMKYYFTAFDVMLMFVIVFLTGFCNAATMLLLKTERFKVVSSFQVGRTLVVVVSQYVLGRLFSSYIGLLAGYALGFVVQAGGLLFFIRLGGGALTKQKVKVVFRRYQKYFKYDVISSLISALQMNVVNFFLAGLYSPSIVGLYGIAYRMTGVPIQLISSTMSQLYFQKGTKAYQETGTVGRYFTFTLFASLLAGMLIVIVMCSVMYFITNYFLGETWQGVPAVMYCISGFLLFNFVISSIKSTPLIIGKPGLLLIFNAGLMVGLFLVYMLAKFSGLDYRAYLVVNSSVCVMIGVFFILKMFSVLNIKRGILARGSGR